MLSHSWLCTMQTIEQKLIKNTQSDSERVGSCSHGKTKATSNRATMPMVWHSMFGCSLSSAAAIIPIHDAIINYVAICSMSNWFSAKRLNCFEGQNSDDDSMHKAKIDQNVSNGSIYLLLRKLFQFGFKSSLAWMRREQTINSAIFDSDCQSHTPHINAI